MVDNKRVPYLRQGDEFPPVSMSRADGLLAAGGDLSVDLLVKAYSNGIFPWYDERTPILWYSPLNRCLFRPSEFKVSASLRQRLRKNQFRFTFDSDFEQVIHHCAYIKRKEDNGTWIIPGMIDAYIRLHREGYAHSVEVWNGQRLAGGLYGVSLGTAFFGESMFHLETDASKAALYYLCKELSAWNFLFIDAQLSTAHLLSLGAITIPRSQYLALLKEALRQPGRKGSWKQ